MPARAVQRGEDGGATHGVRRRQEDRIDLHVDSSPIDLGLVQGFTTALTNVKGTLAGARST